MITKQLLLVISFSVAAGSAFAQQIEFITPDANFVSVKTRADVIAEIKQAREDGSLDIIDHSYPTLPVVRAIGKTRAEVMAEVEQARADGSLDIIDHSYPTLPVVGKSALTRKQVRDELMESDSRTRETGASNAQTSVAPTSAIN
jgi:hypothetical protein